MPALTQGMATRDVDCPSKHKASPFVVCSRRQHRACLVEKGNPVGLDPGPPSQLSLTCELTRMA